MMFADESIVSSTVAGQAVQTALRGSLLVQARLRQLGKSALLTPNLRKARIQTPVPPPQRVFLFPKEPRKRCLRWAIAFTTVKWVAQPARDVMASAERARLWALISPTANGCGA